MHHSYLDLERSYSSEKLLFSSKALELKELDGADIVLRSLLGYVAKSPDRSNTVEIIRRCPEVGHMI
jgi:hypothetical protein